MASFSLLLRCVAASSTLRLVFCYNSSSNQACNVGSLEARIDCGFVGLDQEACEERGCCWNKVDPNPDNAPWCFHQRGRCDVLPQKRQDVHAINPADPDGWSHQTLISQSTCAKQGDCWVSTNIPNPASPDGRNYPWCFYEPGRCDADPSRRVDCGYTGIGAEECNTRGCCWAPLANNPNNVPYCFAKVGFFQNTGSWSLLFDIEGGALEEDVQWGVTTTDTFGITSTITNSFSTSVTASAEFEGFGASGTVTDEFTMSVAASMSHALQESKLTTLKASCPAQVGKHVWMYQWQVRGYHSPTPGSADPKNPDIAAFTEHYMCSYTDGQKQAPQCPFGFCGNNNPNCQHAGCSPWTGPTGKAVMI